ncbi:MAG: VOC family protein [Hamadaea sp.]|uniref:VOC family protein n=1 Tax=Hamadaea sp. TaxID=2024425 RepID=UPI0017C7F0E9|nr:VOC family protein [Hamadaea sp.]NUT20928.1 VOC family protein [Hamadaea sp.]
MTGQITAAEFHAANGVADWRVLYHLVSAHFPTDSLTGGLALATEIGRLADPGELLKIDLRPDGVTVSLRNRDVALARRISAAARELGLIADPTAVEVVNVTIDALVIADVLPFWQAVLAYGQVGDDYLFDPRGRGPGLDFQQMDAPRSQRNRVHLDVAVPHDHVEARISAALAAGGRLVSDAYAPKWWVLADAEGNEACLATWLGRE